MGYFLAKLTGESDSPTFSISVDRWGFASMDI